MTVMASPLRRAVVGHDVYYRQLVLFSWCFIINS